MFVKELGEIERFLFIAAQPRFPKVSASFPKISARNAERQTSTTALQHPETRVFIIPRSPSLSPAGQKLLNII